jgi:asparagine synthase (glutamine-hydrolysing)
VSAIAGFVQFDEAPAAKSDLGRMLDRMAGFRQVDDRGEWCDGATALGLLLERHTPEDLLERQPVAGQDARYQLVGDLRLDNREELAGALGIARRDLPTTADGVLVLRAWIKWQERCAEHLLGDFAFAVWDRLTRSLFCARDHLGVRPFYYARTPKRLVFGSAIKGLLVLPDLTNQLDEYALADYMVALEDDLERTSYRDIKRLPAAHTMRVDTQGRVSIARYWRPDPNFELVIGSDADYTEGLRERLAQSVECRMRSASRTGVLLSGGLDSSTIACLSADAAARTGRRVSAVASVLPQGYSGPERDEWDFIRAVAESRANIDLCRVHAPGMGLLSDLDEMLLINDQPFRDMFHYMTRSLLQTAASRGTACILWGYGGDNLVSSWGAGYFSELLATGRWLSLGLELHRRARLDGSSVPALMRSQLLKPLIPRSVSLWAAGRRGTDVDSLIRLSAVTPELAKRTALAERLDASSAWQRPPRRVREGEWRGLMSRSISEDLEYGAHLSARLGVAWLAPLLDKRLIEYCLALPSDQKVRNGWSRLALRRAADGLVPDSVAWRSDKGAFSPDFHQRLDAEADQMRDIVAGIDRDSVIREYVDVSKLEETVQKLRANGGTSCSAAELLLRLGAGLMTTRFVGTAMAGEEPATRIVPG